MMSSRATLLALLKETEPRIPDLRCSLVPTSFDPEDPELSAFPRPLEWHWQSIEDMLRAFGSRGILMRLPLFWQVEPALFAAGQNAGAPIFVNDQDNMPVGAAAIRDASMDTVVTDMRDAEKFSVHLEGVHTAPRAWIIIHALTGEWVLPHPLLSPGAPLVAQEVHLFPGMPLLIQCPALAHTRTAMFHFANGWSAQIENGIAYVTGPDTDPLPLERYELDIALTEKGFCSCGKKTYGRG